MTTKLDGLLKREINIDGKPYTLTLSPNGFTLVPKGRRKGYELAWVDLVSGEAALATALNASLTGGPKPETNGGPDAKEASSGHSGTAPHKSR